MYRIKPKAEAKSLVIAATIGVLVAGFLAYGLVLYSVVISPVYITTDRTASR